MFGNLTHLMHSAAASTEPPKDVPPPTPVNFPRCTPREPEIASDQPTPAKPLCATLQGIIRPTEVTIAHLEALGTRVIFDSPLADLIPDPSYIPDFDAWDALSPDDVHDANESTRVQLNTGNLSPGCQTYLDRARELSIPNSAAYRTVRRMPPPKGQPQARLGNSFEFFRHLELYSTYWDDTSKSPPPKPKTEKDGDDKDSTENAPSKSRVDPDAGPFWRTGTGHQMPPEHRQNILTAFLKLVAYDYGCNVSAPRTEPRLYLTSNPPPGAPKTATPKKSYFSSGCTFIFRTPTTREAARSGLVEGPLAAVSARHSTSFPPPRPAPSAPTSPTTTSSSQAATESSTAASATTTTARQGADRDSTMDLGREIVAALITAQHRAREGKTEKRIGEGAWWTTKPRWGGGPGGPIGREVEMQSSEDVVGDKDEASPSSVSASTSSSSSSASSIEAPLKQKKPAGSASSPPAGSGIDLSLPRRPGSGSTSSSSSTSSLSSRSLPKWPGLPSASGGQKGAKRLKKSGNLAIYDSYRMVRPPAAAWDKKTKYEAIGRTRGADYDDIFVISALFHHISVVRVRVPDRLLAVLDGAPDDGSKAWGQLEIRRSKWFDFFRVEDRIAAMRLLWSMMNYLMRADKPETEAEEKVSGEDVNTGEREKEVGLGNGQQEAAAAAVVPEVKPELQLPVEPTPAVAVAIAPAEVPLPADETSLEEEEEEVQAERKDGQGDVEMANS
ncbi:hypothetical protein QBC37DRAFT_385467 [Rhypophila decipiens]|uniref:Uncharacterized protein n=1 Tax=Rhypophila decipiens TaxID=261697 RepID=A0AAN6YD12_9PEZI|nr:hypothetical protein QBC37DRAFT_385467 [Rhypophila decipiens]